MKLVLPKRFESKVNLCNYINENQLILFSKSLIYLICHRKFNSVFMDSNHISKAFSNNYQQSFDCALFLSIKTVQVFLIYFECEIFKNDRLQRLDIGSSPEYFEVKHLHLI